MEANTLFSELLSPVVFYCLPGIKVSCAYDLHPLLGLEFSEARSMSDSLLFPRHE
jgi:hypothetical protein